MAYTGKSTIPHAAITIEDAMMFERLYSYNEKIIINSENEC